MKSHSLIVYDFYNSKAYMFESFNKARKFLHKNNTGNLAVVAKGDTKYLVLNEHYTVLYAENYNYQYLKKRLTQIKVGSRKRHIVATDLLTNKQQIFPSIRETERVLGLTHGGVAAVLSGKQRSSMGYIFAYTDTIKIPDKLPGVIVNDNE